MSSSSIRSHRVIIASLFLPYNVAIGQSGKSTPDAPQKTKDISMPEVMIRLQQQSETGKPDKLRSIVEDLKDKTRYSTPIVASPAAETANPFSKIPPDSPLSSSKFPSTPASSPRPSILRRYSSIHRSSSRKRTAVSTDEDEPFRIESNPHCNGGLKNAVDSVSGISGGEPPRLRKKLWVGTLCTRSQENLSPALKANISSRLRGSYESEPVWVDENTFERCYDGYCHKVLWPALHYVIPDAPKPNFSATYSQVAGTFEDYVKVNRMFADVIASVCKEGDIIWVNDYHLMLLPEMLRTNNTVPQGVSICFFQHVAFPSSEIFRCLSDRAALLRGVLGADTIGFQTSNYARHFRQTVSRILSLEAVPRGIQLGADFDITCSMSPPGSPSSGGGEPSNGSKGRFVEVGAFPMGIDVEQLKDKGKEPEVAEWVSILKQRYYGMKILVGRDKLDEIQGVKHKILAFERFLVNYPEWQGKVVLIQVALPSSTPDTASAFNSYPAPSSAPYAVASSILTPISHINSRFSTLTYNPVVFLHTQDVSFSQYLALLRVADAFVVTSLREGMALRAHEFVAMNSDDFVPEKKVKGNLILSEFTGSYSYAGFRSCIAINPYDTRGTANAIHQALTMSAEEAQTRWEELNSHVEAQSAQAFVTGFLGRCLRAAGAGERGLKYNRFRAFGSHGEALGQSVELENLKQCMPRLIIKWKHTQRRVILLDWEGTLVPTRPMDVTAESEDAAISVLKRLTEKAEVWVLTGFPVKNMQRLADEVKRIGIVAENGCFVKPRPGPDGESTWVSLVAHLNLSWKGPCLEMLNYFTERTPGAYVEDRVATVVWRYWNGPPDDDCADRQWARRQAAEAQNHIFDSLGDRFGLRIVPGGNSFLVIPNNISRAASIAAVLRFSPPIVTLGTIACREEILNDSDFLLAITGDEKLVRRLSELDNAETCSTSGKGTDAMWVLDNDEVLSVLDKFVEAS